MKIHSRAAGLVDKTPISTPDGCPYMQAFERGVVNAHLKLLNRRHFSIEVRSEALDSLCPKRNVYLNVCEVS
jgi:hypothetical protein